LKNRSQLIDILLRAGVLNARQVEQIQNEQNQWGGRIPTLLIEMGLMREDVLLRVLSTELRMRVAPVERLMKVSPEAMNILPATTCERFEVLPFGIEPRLRKLYLAMSDPTESASIEEIERTTGLEVEAFVSTSVIIRRAIRSNFYGEPPVDPGEGRKPPTGAHPIGRPTARRSPSVSSMQPRVGNISGQYGRVPNNRRPPTAHTPIPGVSGAFSAPAGLPTGTHVPPPGARTGEWHPRAHSMSHPASLELDAATNSMPNVPAADDPRLQQLTNSLQVAERKISELQSELRVLRNEHRASQERMHAEMEAVQQLVTGRFQEQRLLMRNLFDMLVARGVVSKEQLVHMLSQMSDT
jgi:FtsZ-binding cell division protein ZapB